MLVMEMTTVTVRELARNTAEVLDRVAAGERIEVTRNGQPVAIVSAPDPVDAKIRSLIRAGILEPDWKTRQAELADYLRDNPPLPQEPGKRPLSEVLHEMRDEERF